MNHKFCITGVSWRQRVKERSEVTYITPRREIKCYKKVCKSCTFYNRSTFFEEYFITSTLSLHWLCIICYVLSVSDLPDEEKKKRSQVMFSLSSYKNFLLLKTHVTIDCHITDHKLSHFISYLLINL